MVRRAIRVLCSVCALAAMLAMPAAASAYTVYQEGNISSTYTTIFRDLMPKRKIQEDYIFFRSGAYEYVMLVGELEYQDGVFWGDAATEYRIMTNNGYNNDYEYSVREVSDVSLVPGSSLIYSNLGQYPELQDQQDYLLFAQVFILFLYLCLILLAPVMRFPLRNRG